GRGFVRCRLQAFCSGEHVPHAGGVVLVHLAAECLDEIATGHGTWNTGQDRGFYLLCIAQWGVIVRWGHRGVGASRKEAGMAPAAGPDCRRPRAWVVPPCGRAEYPQAMTAP